MTRSDTLLSFFSQSFDKFRDNVYLWENRGDGYQGTTYGETRERVFRFAAGLLALGIKKGDRIALMAEARTDWVIGELGILFTGAVVVPLSVRMNEPEEIRFRLNHSGSSFAVVSGTQLHKIRQIAGELPDLEKIIVLDEIQPSNGRELMLADLHAKGDRFLAGHYDLFQQAMDSVFPGDYASISYTSGTTAHPKGIILTHRNYVTNIRQGYSLMDITDRDSTLLILPWDHAFAHTAGIYCFMGRGASIAAVQSGKTPLESLRNLQKNIREVKPSLMFTVPAIARNFRKAVESSVAEKGTFARKMFALAMKVAYTYNREGWNRGSGMRTLLKPILALFDLLVFRKIREGFGGRLQYFIGGGALLDIDFQRFFYAIGIPMLQGYGLTEASPFISANSMKRHKLGSSGFLVTDLDLKICDEKGGELKHGEKGEIVVRGGNVMAGYWMNEDATREALKDGWLHTGDMGYMDADGFLFVLGRFKSLLIADDGEKYSPEGMEETFTAQSPYIMQCMLYNNQDPYTIVLLVPARDALLRYLAGRGLVPSSDEGIVEALRLIDREVREYRTGGRYGEMFPQRWLPAAVGVLKEPFTEENHLLNFQLKTVRGKVTEHYGHLLQFLFTPEGKNILNGLNRPAMKEFLEGNQPGG